MAKLTKLDKRTLTICGIVFVGAYSWLSITSGFLPLVSAFFITVAALIIQVITCYQTQAVPCKKPLDTEPQKYDPLHDWNNDYSVYRSATAHNDSGFKSMDEQNRSSSIATANLTTSSIPDENK